MKTVTFNLPTINDVDFEILVHPEDTPVEGNASAIDEETDEQIANNIYEQLDNGNIWAWCTVEVKASYKGISASDYLGCCSYKDEADFKNDGYYKDMKQIAFDNLIEELKLLAD